MEILVNADEVHANITLPSLLKWSIRPLNKDAEKYY
jgi:hypothetical protein